MFTDPQILRNKSLPKQICLAPGMWFVLFFPCLPGNIKINCSEFFSQAGVDARLGTVAVFHVAVATHSSKYPTMSWKCKRFPNSFCGLCAILTIILDLLQGHRKKRHQDGWTAWVRSPRWIDQPNLHYCNASNNFCCSGRRVCYLLWRWEECPKC